jgi:hypothetical protein
MAYRHHLEHAVRVILRVLLGERLNRPKWFADSWGALAKSVLALALEDLTSQDASERVHGVPVREDAVAFFESRRFRMWARAAGFSINDTEQAYLSQTGKGEEE